MKKTDLIEAIKEKSGLSKKDAEKALAATLDAIIEAVAANDKVQLTGFGTFEQRQRNARTGVDPRTGNSIDRLFFFFFSQKIRAQTDGSNRLKRRSYET